MAPRTLESRTLARLLGEHMPGTLETVRQAGRRARLPGLIAFACLTLVAAGKITRDETVVIFNTGSGYKYLEAWQAALDA